MDAKYLKFFLNISKHRHDQRESRYDRWSQGNWSDRGSKGRMNGRGNMRSEKETQNDQKGTQDDDDN